MDTHQYEYLLAIAKHQSLSAASRALQISQPSLSYFLKKTESELGHTLFSRHGHSLIPTEAGRIYLHTCQQIINIKAQTYSSIHSLYHRDEFTFTIGLTPYQGSKIFSECFPIFHNKYPNVNIQIVEGYSSTLKKGIDDGVIDIALNRILPEDFNKYSVVSLTQNEIFLCVPPYHQKAHLTSDEIYSSATARLADFEDTPFVMWGPDTANSKVIQKYLKRHHVSLTTVYETNNVLTMDIMLQNNVGAGFLPVDYCVPQKNRVYFSLNPLMYSAAGILTSYTHALSQPEKFLIYLISQNDINRRSDRHHIRHYNELALSIMKEFSDDSEFKNNYY